MCPVAHPPRAAMIRRDTAWKAMYRVFPPSPTHDARPTKERGGCHTAMYKSPQRKGTKNVGKELRIMCCSLRPVFLVAHVLHLQGLKGLLRERGFLFGARARGSGNNSVSGFGPLVGGMFLVLMQVAGFEHARLGTVTSIEEGDMQYARGLSPSHCRAAL